MITKDQVSTLNISFSEQVMAKAHYEAVWKMFQKKHEEMRDQLRKGDTTGDLISDWAISGEFPYLEREQKAREVYDHLRKQVGGHFFFLDSQQSYSIQTSWIFHAGKIAAPIFRYDSAKMRLSLAAEEGTMVEKEIISYRFQPATVRNPPDEKRSQPFIEGLITSPYRQEEGVLESTHRPFSEDDYHYVLMVGQDAALSALYKERILPEATKECLDALLLK